jgi:hypothetical protein
MQYIDSEGFWRWCITHRITVFFWTFPSSGILETRKHDVSETSCFGNVSRIQDNDKVQKKTSKCNTVFLDTLYNFIAAVLQTWDKLLVPVFVTDEMICTFDRQSDCILFRHEHPSPLHKSHRRANDAPSLAQQVWGCIYSGETMFKLRSL